MKILVTGGCGFLGSNLSKTVLEKGHDLVVLDNFFREGSEENFNWMSSLGEFAFYRCDIRNQNDVSFCISTEKPDVIFHVAGQVAMTTSLERPRLDFETNALGTFNLLESLKKFCPNASIFYSSTNKVYGDLENLKYQENETRYSLPDWPLGLPESTPLCFSTPYGCSKGAADQYMTDFYRCYGLKTVVFRHSSIFGDRQFSSFNQGWVGWFLSQALLQKKGRLKEPFTINGDGKQVRDVLFSDDLINCYFKALENIDSIAGEVFNIGGGMSNSLSLLELFQWLEQELAMKLNFSKLPVRSSDQKVFVADISKSEKLFNWLPEVPKDLGLKRMLSWTKELL